MLVLDRASVEVEVVNVEEAKVDEVEVAVVEEEIVAVENVVEMEDDSRWGRHALRGPNKGQGPRLNASESPRRMRMIGNTLILTWLSGQSKSAVWPVYRISFD
jgi:hypothetical protein